MPKVLLLDGNSLLYRGFFAMRALTTSEGLHTNALYALTLMTLTALDRYKPDQVVCAFDHRTPSFRHSEFEEYKAQRQKTPDELRQQAPYARELMKAFGFQLLEEPGYEADDVIATLAEMAKNMGYEVYVVTGDLDALQLVDDARGPVKIVSTVKGLSETVVYDEAAVFARYAITPSQVPDFKALKGDSSDNLPGIPGIGDKTATKLLTEYKSIEELYDCLPEMSDVKLKAKLEPYAEQAKLIKRLATVVRNVPLDGFEWCDDYQSRGANLELLKPLLEKLEFKTFLKKFTTTREKPKDAKPDPSLFDELVVKPQRNKEAPTDDVSTDHVTVSSATGVLLVTTEPIEKTDLMTASIRGIAIAREGQQSEIIELSDLDQKTRDFLADPTKPKITYDSKLLIGALKRNEIEVEGIVFDTLLAAYLINSARSGYPLQGMIEDYLGSERATIEPTEIATALRSLEPVMRARLQRDGTENIHNEIELPLSRIIAEMEIEGVNIDPNWLKTLGLEMEDKLKELENEIYNLNGGEVFAIGSTKQLQYVLFEKLSLPSGKKTKTGYSTDAEVLEGLVEQGHEIAAKILSWREVQKLKSTYVDALPSLVNPVDRKVHTSLRQTVASTGRLSSSNPNLQNIPVRTEIGREIRKAFVTSPGNLLVAADYSQIELRLFAYMTRDPELVRTFEADGDIHRRTGSLIFGVPESEVNAEQRRRAKTINFAVIYGMSAFRLAVELGVTQQVAAEWRKRYFESYPGVREFADKILADAREKGYVHTVLGRRRYVPDITSRVFQFRQAAEREAVNMPVQGTAADIIKLAMLRVDAALKTSSLKGKMILQVHDELLFESPKDEAHELGKLVQTEMEAAFDLNGIRLKADVKIGKNWSEMEQVA